MEIFMAAQSYDIQRSGPTPWYYVLYTGQVVNMGSFGTFLNYIDQQTINSAPTPNWRKLNKRQRLLIRHNYTKYVLNLKEFNSNFTESGTYIVNSQTRYQNYFKEWNVGAFVKAGYFVHPAAANAIWRGGDLTQQVDSKLLSKLSEQNQSSSVMVSLAEAHKTAAHVAQTATRLYEALKALKSCRFGDFTRALGITATYRQQRSFGKKKRKVLYDLHMDDSKNSPLTATKRSEAFSEQRAMYTYGQKPEFQSFLSRTWLEYSYGWKPLLKDVDDVMKALARHTVERQNVTHTVTATVGFENPLVSKTFQASGYDMTYVYTESRKERLTVSFKKPDSLLNAANNFGILNPLEVAWELIPFSFVVDWFLPVGDALRNLTSTTGLEFQGGSRTRHTKTSGKVRIYGNGRSYEWNGAGSRMICSGECTGITTSFELKRTVLVTFPSPTWPTPKDPRSIAHGLSAVALLSSLFLEGPSGSNRNIRT